MRRFEEEHPRLADAFELVATLVGVGLLLASAALLGVGLGLTRFG
jgi:hypothetical protein